MADEAEVRVVDMSGDGTGPWKLFVGPYGVACWPSKPAIEAPYEYAQSVARTVQLALSSRTERAPITHVALRFQDKIWSLPRPYRHHHIIRIISFLDGEVWSVEVRNEDQGFLDANGRYLNRKQALVNAVMNKQVRDETKLQSQLYSEDLW